MTIFQESSSVANTTAVGTSNAGPTTNKRSIESTIVVDDGQIIVLGGLIEDTYDSNRSKVPLLGDIPYLGALFRIESRTKTRTNLMVFLRPVVMRDAATANKLSLDRYEIIRSYQKDQQPPKSVLIPINDPPVIPPLRRVEEGSADLSAPPSSPGTARGAIARPKPQGEANEPAPTVPVIVPVLVPMPSGAASAPPR